jgi:hypothetical protein
MHDDTAQPNHDHDLLEVEALLRSLTADDLDIPDAPPPSVWAGIEAELLRSGDLTPRRPAAEFTAPTGATQVRSLDQHRARLGVRGRPLLAAAAAVVVLVAGAVAVIAGRDGSPEVVATAQLAWDAEAFDPLGADATARAELVSTGDGYQLVLADATLPTEFDEDADLELWLIAARPDGSLDVQPVALVDAGSPGVYDVPTELDPDTYSIVDISIEPRDGDETHSGRSILRGEFNA